MRGWLVACVVIGMIAGGRTASAQAEHTEPLNLDPMVHDGFNHFYNLDYEGAMERFEQVRRDHPQDPMSQAYLLMNTVFRELYDQDLLDATYYARNNFLTSKRDVPVSPQTRKRIEDLTNGVVSICDQRIKQNNQDKDCFFARGYARGLHAVFITLVDHRFTEAAHEGYQSRNDSETVLKLDPNFTDAKMAVGIQQFAVASLPLMVRMVVGIFGVGGNKEKGLQLLKEASAHGTITSVESRTVLSVFLRHDGRYPEALTVENALAAEFPHNFLFRLEVANLIKDSGHGPEAIATYQQVLADTRKPGYFVDPRIQLAYFGLADTQRGQNDIKSAAENYLLAAQQQENSDWLKKRAQLCAGNMLDLLGRRAEAVKLYQAAAAGGGDQSQADAAKQFLKSPYTGK